MPFQCDECGVTFPTSQKLRRHQERKKPCAPILPAQEEAAQDPCCCPDCGRRYARPDGVTRHRPKCRVANDENTQAWLMRRQEEKFEEELARRDAAIADLEARLSALEMEKQKAVVFRAPQGIAGFEEDTLEIPVAAVITAFEENPRLAEYSREFDQRSKSHAYVIDAVFEILDRARSNPRYRNVYVNPRRADQVVVCVGQNWRSRTLLGATRRIFNHVMRSLQQIETDLPEEIQGAASQLRTAYQENPARFITEGSAAIAPHLAPEDDIMAEICDVRS